jgi:hypothetical protein
MVGAAQWSRRHGRRHHVRRVLRQTRPRGSACRRLSSNITCVRVGAAIQLQHTHKSIYLGDCGIGRHCRSSCRFLETRRVDDMNSSTRNETLSFSADNTSGMPSVAFALINRQTRKKLGERRDTLRLSMSKLWLTAEEQPPPSPRLAALARRSTGSDPQRCNNTTRLRRLEPRG